MTLVVNGFLICRSLEEADTVSAMLPERLAAVRAEHGCVAFEVWRSRADPVRFAVHEVFRDREAYETHVELTRKSRWWKLTQRIPREYVLEER
ncbi:MAG: putative quinol monooxygenase [Paracoccaceae bacterium]